MIADILLPVGRLFAATLAGFLVFKIPLVQRHLLRPVVFAIVNVVFPLYFVHTMPSQWDSGIAAGWEWMVIFFLAYALFLGLQYGLGKLLINRTRLLRTDHPQELLVLFTMHNAGYIPIPIIAALAPPAILVYMSFYTMAFVLSFFTIALWMIQSAAHTRRAGRRGTERSSARRADTASDADAGIDASGAAEPARHPPARFRLNAPIVGILLGLLLGVTGWYEAIPDWVKLPFRWSSVIALDGVMVVLGAVIASIPANGLGFRKEFAGLVLVKMVLFPLAVLALLALIPLRGIPVNIAAGIKLAFMVQAVVPPSTNLLVLTKAFGTDDQTHYAGGAIVTTYAASLVLLPLFIIASTLLFG